MRAVTLAMMTALAGCGAPQPPLPPSSPSVAPPAGPMPTAVATAAATPPSAIEPASITFIENDYARALTEARTRGVPLFVDAWATWCHTCLSMKSYVFPDPRLRGFGPRFVWLAIDTERDENAPLVARLGVRSLPTLYVIDSASEQPVLAWPGSLTAPELGDLLHDAELAARRGDAGGRAAAALLRGYQASAAGKSEEALTAYREALAEAPAGWPRRPQAVDALVTRLSDDQQLAACTTTAADQAPQLPPGTALADVLRAGLGCISQLPASAPERARLAELVATGERVAIDLTVPILADDRSDLYDYVVHGLGELGETRAAEMKRVAAAWAAFLEDQAAKAPTPAARSVFDAHRLLAYVAVGEPARAVPMLEQSERDFPADYNPPARLARAMLAMRRYGDALAAVKRALERAYGPRKLTLWALEADIFEAQKDRASAHRALEEAVAFAKTVPLMPGYARLRDALAKRADTLR